MPGRLEPPQRFVDVGLPCSPSTQGPLATKPGTTLPHPRSVPAPDLSLGPRAPSPPVFAAPASPGRAWPRLGVRVRGASVPASRSHPSRRGGRRGSRNRGRGGSSRSLTLRLEGTASALTPRQELLPFGGESVAAVPLVRVAGDAGGEAREARRVQRVTRCSARPPQTRGTDACARPDASTRLRSLCA